MSLTPPPFVLTLSLDQNSFATLDSLRQQYFPPERNFLPAHVTLFHALPAEREAIVRETLRDVCSRLKPLPLRFPALRLLGRGVAVEVHSPELIAARTELFAGWSGWLGAQDKQKYQPHVTIQNKVMADEARRLYGQLASEWQGFTGDGGGLTLWRYLGGPWELASEYLFAG